MSDMIEVKVEELSGAALDWSVAIATGWLLDNEDRTALWSPSGEVMSISTQGHYEGYGFRPSVNWGFGGPLIGKYGVLLSPPKSLVHRNYGNFDKRNGWYESGVWGSTIFGKERKHRRRSFEHPDQPLVAAMRAIVQFELGDVVSVPAALVEGGAK